MVENPAFRVRFWGVRGSYAAPGSDTIRYGGNTSCVEVQAGGKRIVLDAGSGIIPLGKHIIETTPDGQGQHTLVLISHYHFDHIQGLPFFRPAFLPSHRVYVYAPSFMNETPRATFDRLMVSPMCPFDLRNMPGVAAVSEVKPGERFVWSPSENAPRPAPAEKAASDEDVLIEPYVSYDIHPRDGVVLYRLRHRGRSMVYATDVEGVHDEVIEFARGADLLILDAMYKKNEYETMTRGWGHSTVGMAREVAQRADVARFALFHHSPDHDDDTLDEKERFARKDFPAAFCASEGQTVEF
jgi:phosphoribosyl 1,2-cyclic phosphodiesterase